MIARRPSPDPQPDQLRAMALAMHRRLVADGGLHFADRLAAAFDLEGRRRGESASLDFDLDDAPAPAPVSAPAHWQDTRASRNASPDPRGRALRHGAQPHGRTR